MRPARHRGHAGGCVLALLALLALLGMPAAANVDAALREAREAAGADRHADAIAAFARAEEAAPQRRSEWLLEWADQYTWAQQLDTAIGLYRQALQSLTGDAALKARLGLARALARAGRYTESLAEYGRVLAQDPRNHEAPLGRARVLGWSDRQSEAVQQYRQLLRDHPDDHDAQRGYARALSWAGRHRLAVEQAEAFVRQRPHDRESVLAMAESLDWMGRVDRALPLLRQQVDADPGDDRAATLLRRLQDAQRPEFSADVRHFDQSDELGIDEIAIAMRWSVQDGRGQLRPRYIHSRYRPATGPVQQIEVQRPGLDARYRISDELEWNGSLGLDRIDTRGANDDHQIWTHDTTLTWWPSDVWRLDLSSARWTFDSEEALRSGASARQVKLSLDHLPDELTRLSVHTGHTRYSDGNRRKAWLWQAERRIWKEPRLQLGLRHNRQDFSQPGQLGYYNPDRVHSTELTASAGGWLPKAVYWELRGSLGRESELGQPKRPIRSSGVALSWHFHPGYSFQAAFDHSTSRTLDTGGFARRIVRLSLTARH
jgi:tetratricopeptide (TPR) repeat protein